MNEDNLFGEIIIYVVNNMNNVNIYQKLLTQCKIFFKNARN